MEESYRRAQKLTQLPPFPNFPEALANLVADGGINVTREEAASFIQDAAKQKDEDEQPGPAPVLGPGRVESLKHFEQQGKMRTEFGQIAAEALSKMHAFEVLYDGRNWFCFLPRSWAKVVPENGNAPWKPRRPVSVFCSFGRAPSKSSTPETRISLHFYVTSMKDPALRVECVKALRKAGFNVGQTPVWSQFFVSKRPVADPADRDEVREAMEKLLAAAKDEFSKAQAVLTSVFQ
jgi:hypothetical protein